MFKRGQFVRCSYAGIPSSLPDFLSGKISNPYHGRSGEKTELEVGKVYSIRDEFDGAKRPMVILSEIVGEHYAERFVPVSLGKLKLKDLL